jgi:hypothetical protein
MTLLSPNCSFVAKLWIWLAAAVLVADLCRFYCEMRWAAPGRVEAFDAIA